MRRITGLLCAIAIGLAAAVVAARQTTAPAALPPALRTQLQNGKFQIITSIRGLPLGVREEMTKMFSSGTLDIAEPGTPFQSTGATVSPRLPTRRLIAASCSNEFYCLVYYERGGSTHTWHVALFRWTPEATRFEWGGIAPGGFKTSEDVRKAILSGALKVQAGSW